MRVLLLAVLAAAIGALAAVQVTSALRQRDAYPRGVMDVMAFHAGKLHESLQAQRCNATVTGGDLAMLVAMSGDIPHAFPALMQDRRFAKFATGAHALNQRISSAAPNDCAALGRSLTEIDQHCDECHRIYR